MKRLAYVDWMRGLACVLMFETHCYDSWLSEEAKKSDGFRYSQMGGTLPAPLFIFLAGVAVALVTEKLRGKGVQRATIAKQVMWRGTEVFGLGMLFRVQEFVLGIPISPWTDLLRVDVLNILGISMMVMGVVCWLTAARSGPQDRGNVETGTRADVISLSRNHAVIGALVVAAFVALATP